MIPLVLSLVLAAPAYAQTQTQSSLRVRPLVRDGQVLVSFSLDGVFTEAMREQVQSGLRTTFTYTVELKQKAPAWVDRTIASAVVSASVEYDNLTRRTTVTQTLDGRMGETRESEDMELARQLATSFERLPLFKTQLLEVNREYYLLVRAEARPQNRSAFWPFGGSTSASVKFTFLP
jgi:hypothetical protein